LDFSRSFRFLQTIIQRNERRRGLYAWKLEGLVLDPQIFLVGLVKKKEKRSFVWIGLEMLCCALDFTRIW
jgi:hypothetical protein